MIWQTVLIGVLGACAGGVISWGAVALIIGLGIVPRYASLTKTAEHVRLYETVCTLGVFFGNLAFLYQGNLHLGTPGFLVYGLCAGIFLGSWIIALGEVVDVYAIMARRLGITRGIPLIILSMAVGKSLGSLLFFYKGWW